MDFPTYAQVGNTGRIIVARLGEGDDVLDAAVALIEEHDIRCGTITAMGGLKKGAVNSPRSFHFQEPSGAMLCHRMEGPVELATAHGVFGRDGEGNLDFHVHGVIMNSEGSITCGDLILGQNPVWSMVELVITEVEGIQINPLHNRIPTHYSDPALPEA